MNILSRSKNYLLASAISLFSAGAVWPADYRDDAQQQARLLLTGHAVASSSVDFRVPIPPQSASQARVRDGLDLARRMILGPPSANRTMMEVVDRQEQVDAQQLARQMILGRASSTASATTDARRRHGVSRRAMRSLIE